MAAVSAAVQTPSPFAVLLRRSKFASYDPMVGQIYTAHGGNAHRGNYGLKRPLALHQRNKYIKVLAVDSPHQHTDWHFAESEARFVKRWDELGVTPRTRGRWDTTLTSQRQWVMDSEFGKRDGRRGAGVTRRIPSDEAAVNEEDADQASRPTIDAKVRRPAEDTTWSHGTVVPNIERMSPSEFRLYLKALRAHRSEFLTFLKEESAHSARKAVDAAASPKTGPRLSSVPQTRQLVADNAFDEATSPSTSAHMRREFLAYLSRKEFQDWHSRALEQQPHRSAGLTYAHESALTNYYLTKPQPGRYLTPRSVAFAGMDTSVAQMSGRNFERGQQATFRLAGAVLNSAPALGAPLRAAHLTAVVVDTEPLGMQRSNPHRPGTRAYIAHGGEAKTPFKARVTTGAPTSKWEGKFSPRSNDNTNILATLKDLLPPEKERGSRDDGL